MCTGSPSVGPIDTMVSSTDQSASSYGCSIYHFSVLGMLFMSSWSRPCPCRDREGKTLVLVFRTEISDALEAVSWAPCESGDETRLSRPRSSWPGPRWCSAHPLPHRMEAALLLGNHVFVGLFLASVFCSIVLSVLGSTLCAVTTLTRFVVSLVCLQDRSCSRAPGTRSYISEPACASWPRSSRLRFCLSRAGDSTWE